MKLIYTLTIGILFLISCNTEQNNNNTKKDTLFENENNNENNNKPNEESEVKFITEFIEIDDMPYTNIGLEFEGRLINVGNFAGSLTLTEDRDRFTVDIPKNAKQIYSAFYAGTYNAVYIVENNDEIKVFSAEADETSSKPYNKLLLNIAK